jgi:hypothetical protein
MEQALEKFAELRSNNVESFSMILASEPKPSAQAVRQAYNELEMPPIDLEDVLDW